MPPDQPNSGAPARYVRGILVVAALTAVAAGIFAYLQYREIHPRTSDAYVGAHVVRIASQVSGPLVEVAVHENQHVTADQLLLEIDPAPFQVAVERAEANLAIASQAMGASAAAVVSAEAMVAKSRAELADAIANARRFELLAETGAASQKDRDDSKTAADTARAALDAAKANLDRARQELGAEGADNAQVQAATAELAAAHLDLEHTTIRAPADGWVTDLSARAGTYVEAGVPLFALVESSDWWVDANFKETDVERIREGQPAEVVLDLYPDVTLAGTVESISAGSGAAFSLLPPENATGNWVKVTQRFPVRVRIDPIGPQRPLRVGASATVTVDTRDAGDPSTGD
jgi:membrane fusion protein (multidrug efflux system)